MRLRAAGPADLPEIAEVQIASWQSAYRGLLSPRFLDTEVPGLLRRRWQEWPGPDWRVEVAEQGAAVMGFVSLDLAHTGGPYVDNLHVRPGNKGRGIGRALMAQAAQHAVPKGGMWLTVIAGNTEARAAYKALGGTEAPEIEESLFGQSVRALPVTWGAAALRALAGGPGLPMGNG